MISAVIITFNEEKKIARCIDSLNGVADELVVVDSFSTDATVEICKAKSVRFIQHAFEGYIQQKNFAVTQATNDFILSLDADECLSEELRLSILAVKNDLKFDGYIMNRRTNFCGQWIHHSGWYPDRKLRLWNRNKGAWGGTDPHDKV
ncbi:MAG: glycosyltransferase family 2 protein, partial [Chitinophagales bacterium]